MHPRVLTVFIDAMTAPALAEKRAETRMRHAVSAKAPNRPLKK